MENAWEIQKDQSICFCLKPTLFEASIFFLVVLAVAEAAPAALRPWAVDGRGGFHRFNTLFRGSGTSD